MKTYTIIAGADDVGKHVYLNLMQTKPNNLGLVFCDLTSVYLVAKNPVQCMEKSYNFTVETTLLSDEAILLAKMAKSKGYKVQLHFIGIDERFGLLSEDENDTRRERFNRQTGNVLKLLEYCDCGVFVDNNSDFSFVAKYADGNITMQKDTMPLWLEQIVKEFNNKKDV